MDQIDKKIIWFCIKIIGTTIIICIVGFLAGFLLRATILKTAMDFCISKPILVELNHAKRREESRIENHQLYGQRIGQTGRKTKKQNPRLSAKLLHRKRIENKRKANGIYQEKTQLPNKPKKLI
jgi:stalled ribosome alternative rescue factor ArfA